MLTGTYDVLKASHLLGVDRQARKLAELLQENPVLTPEEVDDLALINDEMRIALFGDSYDDDVTDELNQLVGELTRPRGRVHEMLNGDGHCLCSTTVRRKIRVQDDGSVVVNKTARFVSNEPRIVDGYRLTPQVQRLERGMERLADLIEADTQRLPALAARVPGLITHARMVMDAQLPAPEEDEEDED
jgi:hypothetical protein